MGKRPRRSARHSASPALAPRGRNIRKMDPVTAAIAAARAVKSAIGRLTAHGNERRVQLREGMMADAADFVTGVQQAVMGVRDAVQQPARQLSDVSVVWKALPELGRLVGEAEARLSRVQLDFDPDLEAGTSADAAIGELRTAVALLQVGMTDLQGAADAADRAEQHLRAFNKAAGRAIRR